MTDSRKGTLYMFLSAVLFSIGGLCVKMIPWSAVAINGARSLISVVILLIYAKAARHRLRFNPVILAGAVCTFITNLFFYCAAKMTTAANAIVLEFTMPVFIILFSWLFFRQRPKKAGHCDLPCSICWDNMFFYRRPFGGEYTGEHRGTHIRYDLCRHVHVKRQYKGRCILFSDYRAVHKRFGRYSFLL